MTQSFAVRLLVLCIVMASGSALAAQTPPTVAEVRRALAPLQPGGVRIDSVKIADKRSTVLGRSPSNSVLSEFMRSIDTSASFERVELAEVQAEASGVRFELFMDIICSDTGEATCLVPEKGAAAPARTGGVHKCRIDGALRFQDRPCAPGTEAP